jgi:hypothetical protein
MMGREQKKIEKRWKQFQEMQGYTDEEIAGSRSNPRYVKAMENAPGVKKSCLQNNCFCIGIYMVGHTFILL